MSALSVEERLVLVADTKPTIENARLSLLACAQLNAAELHSTGVRTCVKLTHVLRSSRDKMLDWVKQRDLNIDVMVDVNIAVDSYDLAAECLLLGQYKPKMITVLCAAGIGQLKTLKAMLPDTEIVAVPAPVGFSDADSRAIYGQPLDMAVQRLITVAKASGVGGIMVPRLAHIDKARRAVGPCTNLMAQEMVRPISSHVAVSDYIRGKMPTVTEAIMAGADRVLVPAHFVLDENERMRRNVLMSIFSEIEEAIHLAA